jgi:SAM-dependent methyltransferase
MTQITDPKRFIEEWGRATLRDPFQHFEKRIKRICPVCDYSGLFTSMYLRGRREARCPNCASLERHRQFVLILKERNIDLTMARVIHFAPERVFLKKYYDAPNYVFGDLNPKPRYGKRLHKLDISNIDFPDESFDYLIAFDVMEHVVDHMRAYAEITRVLKPGGQAFLTVPIIYALKKTYTPPANMPQGKKDLICGGDHKRLYGRDFPDFLINAGLDVEEYCSEPEDALKYALVYNIIFVATKRSETPAYCPKIETN